MFKKIFEYAGPYKKNMYVATVVVLVSVLMGVIPFILAYQVIAPLVMGKTIDAAFIILRVVLVLLCLVLQAIFYGWGLNISHKAAYDTLLRLRTALQKRFEKLPLGVIQDKGTGTVKKLFVDDVDSLEVLLAHSMPEGIANLMIPIAVYVAMFFVDWKLALLSLASIPISLIAMMTMYSVGMKKMGPYYMAGQKMNNTIIEYINGMEVVKVFNKDADSYERFRKDVSDYRDYTLAWYKAAWPWMAIYSSLLPCTIILTLPLGSWFVLSGWSALPDLILVLCLSLSIGMPLLKSLGFLPTMPQLNYKISALEQVLDAPELQQTPDSFHGKDDSIVYDHVSFGYTKAQPGPDGKPMVVEEEVLHDISFTAKAGQKTALVGESGSGKSTLAKLLIHYYDPQKGSISLGGQKLCDMSLEALNSRISYVAQDQYLFNTSLLENILDHRERLFSDSLRLTTECIPNLLVQSLSQIVGRSLLEILFFYIKVNGKIFQHIHTEAFQIISILVFFHQCLANIIHIVGNIHSDSLSQQSVTSLLVDHLTLRVHHIVIFQQTLTNTEVIFLHLTLCTLDRFGNHGMLNHVTFLVSQTVHHPNDSLGTEQTHQIIFQ